MRLRTDKVMSGALRPAISRQTPRLPVWRTPAHRPFTKCSYVLSHPRINSSTRPQLPFLNEHQSISSRRQGHSPIRYLTTDQKDWIKHQIRLGLYWTLVGWLAIFGASLGYFILNDDWLDRKYPSPKDWPWYARHAWRIAEHERSTDGLEKSPEQVDWAAIGSGYRIAVTLAEAGATIASWGSPLPTNAHVDWEVPGLDKVAIEAKSSMAVRGFSSIGPDISSKSKEWKQAYFEAVMGIAKVSEKLEDWVLDTTRNITFPKNTVVGPSNPFPKRGGRGDPESPLEQNCRPCYDSPALYYSRILTTHGFSRQQRMQAGLAYAAWLDYRGENETAGEVYQWALSIASEGVESATKIIDINTGRIHVNAPFVTANILDASTALATHEALTGNIANSLNIFSSVLRARRNSPEAPSSRQYEPKGPDMSLTSLDSVLGWLTSLHRSPQMKQNVPTGDEPFERTKGANCEEAALMTYLGEIIFSRTIQLAPQIKSSSAPSTSPVLLNGRAQTNARQSGLAWTREAVSNAEFGYQDPKLDRESRKKCAQCMAAGLENWHRMVKLLAAEERRISTHASGGASPGHNSSQASGGGWLDWVPFWGSKDSMEGIGKTSAGGWQEEEKVVAARKAKFFEDRLMIQLNQYIRSNSEWFVA